MTNETNFSEAEKLKYILDQVNSVAEDSEFIKQAKKNRIKFYTRKANLLSEISMFKIYSFSFQDEIIRDSQQIEKVKLIQKFLNSQNIRLERHSFAPELNKVYFNKRIINTPHVAEIEKEVGEAKLREDSSYINLKQFLLKKSLCDLQILLSFN